MEITREILLAMPNHILCYENKIYSITNQGFIMEDPVRSTDAKFVSAFSVTGDFYTSTDLEVLICFRKLLSKVSCSEPVAFDDSSSLVAYSYSLDKFSVRLIQANLSTHSMLFIDDDTTDYYSVVFTRDSVSVLNCNRDVATEFIKELGELSQKLVSSVYSLPSGISFAMFKEGFLSSIESSINSVSYSHLIRNPNLVDELKRIDSGKTPRSPRLSVRRTEYQGVSLLSLSGPIAGNRTNILLSKQENLVLSDWSTDSMLCKLLFGHDLVEILEHESNLTVLLTNAGIHEPVSVAKYLTDVAISSDEFELLGRLEELMYKYKGGIRNGVFK